MILYKIRNKEGKFCNGRKNVKFVNDGGKVFRNINDVTTFLNKFDEVPDDWVVIESDMMILNIKGYNPKTGEEYDIDDLWGMNLN